MLLNTFIACSSDDDITSTFLDCDEKTGDYQKYNDEEIECQFYYTLTEFNGQQYIELSSRCADLSRTYAINVDCVDICENPLENNSECSSYIDGRKVIEIILIEK